MLKLLTSAVVCNADTEPGRGVVSCRKAVPSCHFHHHYSRLIRRPRRDGGAGCNVFHLSASLIFMLLLYPCKLNPSFYLSCFSSSCRSSEHFNSCSVVDGGDAQSQVKTKSSLAPSFTSCDSETTIFSSIVACLILSLRGACSWLVAVLVKLSLMIGACNFRR